MFTKSLSVSVLLSFFATVSYACPDLSGTYQCAFQVDGEKTKLVIQQEGNKFSIKGLTSDSTMNVDANGKKLEASVAGLETKYSAQCDSNSLKIESSFFITKDKSGLVTNFEYKKTSDNSVEFLIKSALIQGGVVSANSSTTFMSCDK